MCKIQQYFVFIFLQCVWPVTKFTITQLVRCLRAGEDEIVQHYAAKTIENVWYFEEGGVVL